MFSKRISRVASIETVYLQQGRTEKVVLIRVRALKRFVLLLRLRVTQERGLITMNKSDIKVLRSFYNE